MPGDSVDTIYADDTTLVADSHASMQETVQRFSEVAECFGLLINQSKTVVMRAVPNASVTPQPIYIGGNALQDVSSFSYLGSVITPNNDMQEEIDSRVAKARRAYHMLSRQRGIRRRTKVKVFNAVVTSTLLYGAGTWTRKESQTKRLESVQYRLARRMLGVKPTDHVCMTKAYESLGMTSLRVLLNRRTMAWATRLLAMEDTRLPKTVMFSRMAKRRRPWGRHKFQMVGHCE